jgi:hypothetical protein
MAPHGRDHDDEDENMALEARGPGRRFGDFDCPDCSANNPYDDAFGDGDEIRCYYCGAEYRASVSEEGRLKLKAI